MSHTYSALLYHIVWSTKERRPLITSDIEEGLYEYIGGIIRKKRALLLAIGGVSDHVHMLVSVSPDIAPAELVMNIKSGASRWINKAGTGRDRFYWQEGYGIFSVSQSAKDDVTRYIHDQKKHHAKFDFQYEWLQLLKKHQIQFNPEYAFG